MHKKTDTNDLDIPKDDIDCWERYSKHRWVYDLSRLLDAQNIKWSPFEVDGLPDRELNIKLETNRTVIRQPGFIYIKKPEGRHTFTEMYLIKGEIKLMRHVDPDTGRELESLFGEVELRLNAFATLYFQKFTGVITAETYANEIFRIRLSTFVDTSRETNLEVIKLVKRIYKKNEVIVHGLTDRALQETLAS
jgi:hypothetical protein